MDTAKLLNIVSTFAIEFANVVKDEESTNDKKMTFFYDNMDIINKYCKAMHVIIDTIKNTPEQDLSEEDNQFYKQAKSLLAQLDDSKNEMTKLAYIKEDAKDSAPTLTEDTIKDALHNNKTTQEIHKNMNEISAQAKAANDIPYNYVLVCDGQMHMINAIDKSQLIQAINTVIDTVNPKDFRLYKLAFTPVPLKKKTIISI